MIVSRRRLPQAVVGYILTNPETRIIIKPRLATARDNPGKCQLFDMLPNYYIARISKATTGDGQRRIFGDYSPVSYTSAGLQVFVLSHSH